VGNVDCNADIEWFYLLMASIAPGKTWRRSVGIRWIRLCSRFFAYDVASLIYFRQFEKVNAGIFRPFVRGWRSAKQLEADKAVTALASGKELALV